ncbi:MAG TPA: hypothetical protein VJQ61_16040 [Sinomonas sp.]|nr:hypothetical protein [Sinomonas sp.]
MSDAHDITGAVDDDMLANYLHSHLIAASSGKHLFDEATKVWSGTPHGPTIERLAREVSEDRDELERIVQGLGLDLPAYKKAAAWVGAQVSKIDPINPGHSPGGHTGQLELESLISAVTGKSLLWETLLILSEDDVRIDAFKMEHLHDRALKQVQDLSEFMRSTVRGRFHAASATNG